MSAEFSHSELAIVTNALKSLFYWYDRGAALAFLKCIGGDEAKLQKSTQNLTLRRTEPGRS